MLVSCGGGGGSNTSAPVVLEPGVIKGIVQDGSGNALAGATVTAVGKTITTGTDGAFSFTTEPTATQAVVLVKKSGFSTVAKEVPVSAATTSTSNIKVFADMVSTTFSSTTAANIAVGTAKVQIPANALKYADGTDFTGTVKIGASYYSPDTIQGVQAFAGPYIGDNGGEQWPIISMGFVEVKLTDRQARRCNSKQVRSQL
jgi:Carboxypeptidase regulatory-like domain